MTNKTHYDIGLKEIVTVTEHCRALNFSRSRYYQLVKQGIFLPPVYDVQTKRGYVPRDIQQLNLEARWKNCGVNGRSILFYSKLLRTAPATLRLVTASRPPDQHKDIAVAVKGLGLQVTAAQVAEAVKAVYPQGLTETTGQAIRMIFLHLRRESLRNTGDNTGQ